MNIAKHGAQERVTTTTLVAPNKTGKRRFSMNGFATKVTYSFAFLGSSLLAAQAPASSDDSNSFSLQNARSYVSGAASETI